MDLLALQEQFAYYTSLLSSSFQRIPGSAMLLRYIRSSYQDDPVRSAIELVLVLFFVRYLIKPSYSTHRQNYVSLTENEIDDLVEEWTPEPLTAELTEFERSGLEKLPVVVGPSGPKTKLATGKTVTNLATYNYYNLSGNEEIKQGAINTLRTYGVGPCGPPNFYGTQDVHIKVENDFASHIGTEACIIYAHNTSTIPSVMSSFAKRGDVLVADKGCNKQIAEGLRLSRSTVKWFEHNDMKDLERVLREVYQDHTRRGTVETFRRFIIVEGLFEYTGEIIDLPTIVKLGNEYKFRFILDETWSYGVLGRTGRGITEAQNVDPKTLDMIVGSPAGPLCGGGGFCAGGKDVVEHQRIAAPAYTFSAALPAMHATTASATLAMLQTKPEILAQSRENTKAMRAQLDPRSDWITVTSCPENPCIIAVLKNDVINSRRLSHEDQERVLQECVDEALSNGVLITRLKTMPDMNGTMAKDWQHVPPQPALKICVTTGLTKKEIEKAGTVVRHAVTKVLTKGRSKTLGVPSLV